MLAEKTGVLIIEYATDGIMSDAPLHATELPDLQSAPFHWRYKNKNFKL